MVPAKMFKPGMDYKIRLKAGKERSLSSFTEYAFKTTNSPYGGSCSISPREGNNIITAHYYFHDNCWLFLGLALDTQFQIVCPNWVNPLTQTDQGLIYRVYSEIRGNNSVPEILYFGASSTIAGLSFPPGNSEMGYMYTITVEIRNELDFDETLIDLKV